MRWLTLHSVMTLLTVVALLFHYLGPDENRPQPPKKEYLWRAVVYITDRRASPEVTAIWWMQVAPREADVVQIPPQVLIAPQTGENTPTLASLYGTSHFEDHLLRFVRYALGLPAERVIACSLQDMLKHTVGDGKVSLSIPRDVLVVLGNRSVLYGRGKHHLGSSHLQELWSGYSFWGGEWSRLQRQRLILTAVLEAIPPKTVFSGALAWLTQLRYRHVNYLVVPASRRNSWTGPLDDAMQVLPGSFHATARWLREKDRRSDVQVHLCFSPEVSPAVRRVITEKVFDSGFSVYLVESPPECPETTRNTSEDVAMLQQVLNKYAHCRYFRCGKEQIHVMVE